MVNELEISLIETLRKSELGDVLKDLAEAGVDSFLEDGFLKEIPVVSTVLSLGKLGRNIKDYLFIKKLIAFLSCMSEMPPEERQELIARLESDKEYGRTVGENIIEILARLDDERKPRLVAKAFVAYAKGKVNGIELQRINYAIDRLLVLDIQHINEFVEMEQGKRYGWNPILAQQFQNAGLAYMAGGVSAGEVWPNEICYRFAKHVL